MNPTLSAHKRQATALTVLFTRYIAGEIAEQKWRKLSALLDSARLSPEERLAFARYFSEVYAG